MEENVWGSAYRKEDLAASEKLEALTASEILLTIGNDPAGLRVASPHRLDCLEGSGGRSRLIGASKPSCNLFLNLLLARVGSKRVPS